MKAAVLILTLLLSLQISYGQTSSTVSPTELVNKSSTVPGNTTKQTIDTVLRTNYVNDMTVYYRYDDVNIDPAYLSNAESLAFIDKQLSSTTAFAYLDSLAINAMSSPEGPFLYNEKLSQRRAESLRNYLLAAYPHSATKIKVGYSGEDWVGFRKMVVEDDNVPHKLEVLSIIDSENDPDSKEQLIKEIAKGKSWIYIKAKILPYLRSGASAIFYYDIAYVEKYISEEPKPEPEPIVEPKPELIIEPTPTPEPTLQPEIEIATRPLFALKTNLLFDAATLINVELEIPIKQRWSIAAEWIFPWWTWDDGTTKSSRHRIQLLQGNLMGKYWFGDITSRPQMTGWFAGVYAGAGLYDFEYEKDGVQGEFFIAGGLAGGYAHTLNKSGNLRMEYSLGVGYLQTDYRRYTSEYYGENDWRAIRTSTGNYSWFGPTQAKISLVWMLNHKTKRGGVR